MTSKKTVFILFGGKSVEHEISINSAKNVAEYLDKDRYKPLLVGISPEGDWYLKDEVDGDFTKGSPLSMNLSSRNFFLQYGSSTISPDIVFPVLHGTDGEDGSVQGLLQAFEVPFVGTGVLGSAMAMNKICSKRLLREAGIPVSNYKVITQFDQDTVSFESLHEELGLPFMVKAANLGSSVGIFKVNKQEDYERAMSNVFLYDHIVLFEEYVEGRELECAIMGNKTPKASMPGEIVISDKYEFYTYEAKYLDPDAVKIEVPANVDSETAKRIRELSVRSYQALHCEDFARVDLFLKKNGDILINEINSIPGFTNSSMFPMMWQQQGINFKELITGLIEMSLDRFEQQKQIVKEFKNT